MPQTHFEPLILRPPPLQCWNYRPVPPHPVHMVLGMEPTRQALSPLKTSSAPSYIGPKELGFQPDVSAGLSVFVTSYTPHSEFCFVCMFCFVIIVAFRWGTGDELIAYHRLA